MNAERRIPIVLVVVSLALVLLVPTSPWAQSDPARLSDVTVTPHPDSVTVFVKTSREATYKADLVDSPNRLVIDLENTVYAWRKTPLSVGKDPVKQVRGSQYRQGVARVVLDLSRTVGYAIREESDGLAIVIPTAAPPAAAGSNVAAAPAPRETQPAPGPRPVQLAQAPPSPATPAPSNGQRLISFDFKDADVVNLLRILAAESNKNVVIGDDVKGKMSITLKNVPWDLALDTILETRGLRKVEKDGVLRIVSNEQLIKEREASVRVEEARMKAETDVRTKIAEAQLKEQEAIDKKRLADAAMAELRARGPLREETIRLSYADPDEVTKTLQGILGIPPSGVQAQIAPVATGDGMMPIIPGPPFSALYGTAPQIPQAPPPSPTADVLAKGITIRSYKPTNSIFIRHYEADLERIKTLIREKLDIPLPQVKIEARMEILDRDDLFAIGVQWGGGGAVQANQNSILVGRGFTSDVGNGLQVPGGVPMSGVFGPPNVPTGFPNTLPVSGTTGLPLGGNLVNLPIGAVLGGGLVPAGAGGIAFGFTSSRYNVNLALEALRLLSKTRTLARPEVVTVENGIASISLGEEIPYATVSSAGTQIQFKEAVLRLEVIPTVIREGDVTKIKMKVTIENNSRSNTTVNLGTTAGAPPVINKRKAQTEVLIKEGERLVIGGVTTNLDQDETRKIPLFGDIPVIGWLFKQTASQTVGRELVVFITPSVLKVDTAQAATPPKK
jgi:type IV pilus assembly protein PilQ